MCHRVLFLCGFLLLGLQCGWQTLAEDCMDIKIYTTKVASCCHLEEFLTLKTYGSCLNTMEEKYPDSTLDYLVCGLDCTYREMGILTGEDDINVEQISTNQAVHGEAYQEAIAKAVDACLTQREEFREQAKLTQTECIKIRNIFHHPKSNRNCRTAARRNHSSRNTCRRNCYQQCIYEELEAVDGLKIRVEKLYAMAEGFPADYRHAVHLAIDECAKRLRKTRHMFEQMNAQCSLFGFAVDRCVRLLIYDNCPTARWSAGVACTKSRQGVPFC
ncbi:uncharacterized protein LOC120895315 [Anopheles arabiensis]|uniref:uncharacterized protein LOC120895315 n=1 Tax=Anopheles arabiensis TaxID=7173 RepID=UPI001AAD71FA|nr:uncharacterized protein LOC120895315 [Anopheles arabiensis]